MTMKSGTTHTYLQDSLAVEVVMKGGSYSFLNRFYRFRKRGSSGEEYPQGQGHDLIRK